MSVVYDHVFLFCSRCGLCGWGFIYRFMVRVRLFKMWVGGVSFSFIYGAREISAFTCVDR